MKDFTKPFGREYSNAYDILYRNKDYEKECDFLEAVFRRRKRPVRRILDLGCGTGGHALILAKRGYEVTGVDRSSTMLALARRKALREHLPTRFINKDIRSLMIDDSFDAVIAMFAVMGYQVSNDDVAAVCATARKHLAGDGVFVFDCWNGSAVITQRPSIETRRVKLDSRNTIIRRTEPALNVLNHTVRVRFRLKAMQHGRARSVGREEHVVRFFFPQEISRYLELAGFAKVAHYPFFNMRKCLTDRDWNMIVVAETLSAGSRCSAGAVEEIIHDGHIIGIVLRKDAVFDKITFFSKPDFSQQLGFLPHKRGSVIHAHFHKEVRRHIQRTQEVLFLKTGRVIVNFYTTGKQYICSRELTAGDCVFLCGGGHGFKVLEDSAMIEVKQGPYSGRNSDKEIFEGIEK